MNVKHVALIVILVAILLPSLQIVNVKAGLPGVVGTSTSPSATSYPYQRKDFYDEGRYWVFYSNGSHMVYKTSVDGDSWSNETLVCVGVGGNFFSLDFDGTYVHYARTDTTSVYYCKGDPLSNGTVSWLTTEQTANTDSIWSGTVCVDSSGYPFISYVNGSGSDWSPWVTKSSLNNGTWSVAGGFPYQLNSTTTPDWTTTVVPMSSNRVYAIYASADAIYGKLWSSVAWGSEETITTEDVFHMSAVNYGDTVHFVYANSTTYEIIYHKRTYGSGWGSQQILVEPGTGACAVLSVDDSTGYVTAVWVTIDACYSKTYDGSSWSATTTWFTETYLQQHGSQKPTYKQRHSQLSTS